jgi:hypothetical protein
MSLSANRRAGRLPKSSLPKSGLHKFDLPTSFPVGATYVVEGQGGADGIFRVSSRYVVLPRGQRIELPANLEHLTAGRAMASRRNAAQAHAQAQVKSRPLRGRKKSAGRGTGRRSRR